MSFFYFEQTKNNLEGKVSVYINSFKDIMRNRAFAPEELPFTLYALEVPFDSL